MFWLRNKKIIFLVRSFNTRPVWAFVSNRAISNHLASAFPDFPLGERLFLCVYSVLICKFV